MNLYTFNVPGEVDSRYIEAKDMDSAEKAADKACESHSFLGGPVRPPVYLVGKILPDRRIKLRSGKIIENKIYLKLI